MTNFVTGLVGLIGLITFLGLMLIWVPAPPLIVICVVVVGLLLVDFVGSLRGNGDR
jgi:hypothetical protein